MLRGLALRSRQWRRPADGFESDSQQVLAARLTAHAFPERRRGRHMRPMNGREPGSSLSPALAGSPPASTDPLQHRDGAPALRPAHGRGGDGLGRRATLSTGPVRTAVTCHVCPWAGNSGHPRLPVPARLWRGGGRRLPAAFGAAGLQRAERGKLDRLAPDGLPGGRHPDGNPHHDRRQGKLPFPDPNPRLPA